MQTPQTRYAKSGAVRIAYQVVGQGPLDLVFVPGFLSNLEVHWEDEGFCHLLHRLATFTRLILLDKRGTGLSDRVDAEDLPNLETRMDDVRAVMDAAGSGRAALLGASEGAPMAMLFAATYPERTRALVLYRLCAFPHLGDGGRGARQVRNPCGDSVGQRIHGDQFCARPCQRRALSRLVGQVRTPIGQSDCRHNVSAHERPHRCASGASQHPRSHAGATSQSRCARQVRRWPLSCREDCGCAIRRARRTGPSDLDRGHRPRRRRDRGIPDRRQGGTCPLAYWPPS
jgi:pimeloyl-ACP methyl ester carboxylesterase